MKFKKKKEKKPFNETKLGIILNKGKDIIKSHGKDVLQLGAAAMSGNVKGVIKEVKDIFGKDDSPESNDLLNELSLKEKEMIFEFEKEIYALEIKDRSDARKMNEKAINSDDPFVRRFTYYLATLVILAAISFGVMLFFVEVPEENKRLVEMFADIFLFSGAIIVLQFFFGSSKGSKDKYNNLKEK